MVRCYFCGHGFERTIYRNTLCPQCDGDLKICRNCEFYDETADKQCHEPNAEPVKEKEKANFCGYFRPRQDSSAKNNSQGTDTGSKHDRARESFDNLFK